ncbi:hypothetical protein AUK40_00520 [Candidatus Wirthbacteria bacterium CG2_30_54_11]|uniref:Uncharacterized protein n=1 Tax=Candidatus Wirthbacteria bacterium CG2_30_54_11 TaxID=1817892 RepID=A0A1J5J5A8_9BACT|nr:MAG: hypothetical protein AUK40_00520 [Candidatus Wirthbacteria bacterium CG2_30_54_11]
MAICDEYRDLLEQLIALQAPDVPRHSFPTIKVQGKVRVEGHDSFAENVVACYREFYRLEQERPQAQRRNLPNFTISEEPEATRILEWLIAATRAELEPTHFEDRAHLGGGMEK